MNKIRLEKCLQHDVPGITRDMSEYVFWVTDKRRHARKKQDIDIYECKKCREQLDKDLERQKRIRANEQKQKDEAYERFKIKLGKDIVRRERSMRENLWDSVITHKLNHGQKIRIDYPKEMIRLVRDLMKLKRLIKATSKLPCTVSKVLNKNDITPTTKFKCSKHGLSGFYRVRTYNESDAVRVKCKECTEEILEDYYEGRINL